MEQGYFITGTDTNAGKTWATIALMRYFKQQGKTVVGMKPVAAGCSMQNGKLKNEDALLIQENASFKIDYDLINPYAYELPVSPHIAGTTNPVKLASIVEYFTVLKELVEIVVVEGAGGWYAPLNDHEDISDLAKALALPIILVVGIKLGCINHAKLTYLAIQHSGVPCAGWIAVCVDPHMLKLNENIDTIVTALDVPLLGMLPWLESADFDLLASKLAL
ncbi:dethiobiotin synthase [Methylobacter sp. S3L5C]|uniref:dethiobiotin synthase n=1 Tax=Methylobacter sp. S3L5C TaxID=2839024 RepID=UPI001FAE6862|nr:dethiobiotin synthase [Methylobacter sp. S3L5C]UOA07920.1 dethiobiotin synthase [Methylobacter sp. S3L5C]